MSAPRWIVDRGHAWLEVPLGEAVAASHEVRQVSRFSYVNRDLGLAYLEEDCDAGVWLTWRYGAPTGACFGVHRVDGWSWVRDLPRFGVAS